MEFSTWRHIANNRTLPDHGVCRGPKVQVRSPMRSQNPAPYAKNDNKEAVGGFTCCLLPVHIDFIVSEVSLESYLMANIDREEPGKY